MSAFKTVVGTLPWTDRTEWLYPAADQHTIDWQFERGPIDVDPALEFILPRLKERRTCIQAGGCVGIWPIRLAQFFDRVITFEAEPVNYACLASNTAGVANIDCRHAALGRDNSLMVSMGLPEEKEGHCGAYQVAPDGDIPTVCIDDLGLDDVDLIYLDIEGSEFDALFGAQKTIARCRPIIGLEDTGLHVKYSGGASPVLLLLKMGYNMLCKPFATDVIMVPAC